MLDEIVAHLEDPKLNSLLLRGRVAYMNHL
jgi:hypothetical protein